MGLSEWLMNLKRSGVLREMVTGFGNNAMVGDCSRVFGGAVCLAKRPRRFMTGLWVGEVYALMKGRAIKRARDSGGCV